MKYSVPKRSNRIRNSYIHKNYNPRADFEKVLDDYAERLWKNLDLDDYSEVLSELTDLMLENAPVELHEAMMEDDYLRGEMESETSQMIDRAIVEDVFNPLRYMSRQIMRNSYDNWVRVTLDVAEDELRNL